LLNPTKLLAIKCCTYSCLACFAPSYESIGIGSKATTNTLLLSKKDGLVSRKSNVNLIEYYTLYPLDFLQFYAFQQCHFTKVTTKVAEVYKLTRLFFPPLIASYAFGVADGPTLLLENPWEWGMI